jgi:1-acyl-sn-glycerol-3-phosphate acyltransferase
VSNVEKVPVDKPTILCSNHPNGFLEPCIMACFLPVPLHFLVRGDLFSVKWLKWLLHATNQIPIYRFRDGFSGLRGNDSSFRYCYEVLNDKKHILIFPEGSTKQVRYLRPLQKGLARLAFGTMQEYPNLDIQIVPVYIHFTKPRKFRSEVLLNFGDAISVKDQLSTFREEPKKAALDLTKEIFDRMKELSVDVPNTNDWHIADSIWNWSSTEFGIRRFWPVSSYKRDLLSKFISRLKGFQQLAEEKKNELKGNIESYFKQLNNFNISDDIVKHQKYGMILRFIFLLLGFIPALIGIITAFIPALLAKKFADSKVEDIEFYSSILSTVGLALYLVYYLVLLVLSLVIFSSKGFWVFILPFLAYLTVIYIESFRTFWKQKNWIFLSGKDKSNLLNIRKELSEKLNEL